MEETVNNQSQHQDNGAFLVTLADKVIKTSRVGYYDIGSTSGPYLGIGSYGRTCEATPQNFRELARDAARQAIIGLPPEDLGRIISMGVDLGQGRTSPYHFLRRHDTYQCRGSGLSILLELAELVILARAWDLIQKQNQ